VRFTLADAVCIPLVGVISISVSSSTARMVEIEGIIPICNAALITVGVMFFFRGVLVEVRAKVPPVLALKNYTI